MIMVRHYDQIIIMKVDDLHDLPVTEAFSMRGGKGNVPPP